MATDREVMQQALEALEDVHPSGISGAYTLTQRLNAIEALRARLAEPETCKPGLQVEEPEPVAWRFKPMVGSPWSVSDDGYYISCKKDKGYIVEPLYTTPPPRRPLTPVQEAAPVQAREAVHQQLRAAEREAGHDHLLLALGGAGHDLGELGVGVVARLAAALAVGALDHHHVGARGPVGLREQGGAVGAEVAGEQDGAAVGARADLQLGARGAGNVAGIAEDQRHERRDLDLAAEGQPGAGAFELHIVVAGHDQRAAGINVRLQQGASGNSGLGVQAHQGFVQHPQARRTGTKTRQGHTLPLAL